MSATTDFLDRVIAGGLVFGGGGSALVAGVNTFYGVFPRDPDNAVHVQKMPVPGPERVMGTGTAGVVFHNTNLTLTVRSDDYAVGEQMMKDIIARMDNFTGLIGANDYKWISQLTGVSEYGDDENKRFRFVTMFRMQGPVP